MSETAATWRIKRWQIISALVLASIPIDLWARGIEPEGLQLLASRVGGMLAGFALAMWFRRESK